MLEGHNINSPAPGSIDLDHNIPVGCCQRHGRSSTPLVIATPDDLGTYSPEEPFDSPTTTDSSVPSLVMLPSSPIADKVNLAIEEIISSEQRFVSQLRRLVNIYIPQLHTLFMESEIPSLTRNLQPILDIHSDLSERLEKNRQNRSALCGAIVSYASQLTALHSEFWAGHSGAKALLSRVQSRNPQKWTIWEKERAAECVPEEDGSRPRTFEDLLIAPIWRIFTYHFLVEGLRDTSENDQVDAAVRTMQLVATSVDNTGRLREGEAYTKFILGRMKPVENLNSSFLTSLGPCIRVGALEVAYHEHTTLPKVSHESINSLLSPTTPSVIVSPRDAPRTTHQKATRYKQLVVLLWRGYLVLCKIHDKRMEYEPERWFPLRVDLNTEPTFSTVSLDALRSVEVISSGAVFQHGIRITFGRHVFELGAACPMDRDAWLRDISSARVNSEKGDELVSRSSIRREPGSGAQLTRSKSVPGTSPITTTKGLARALSEGGSRIWKSNRRRKPEKIAIPVEQESSGLEKGAPTSLPSTRSAMSRKSVANHLSSKDVFDQLVAHGCSDLSSVMDPEKYSDRSVTGGGFADIWKGSLQDGTEVAIKVWRFDSIDVSEDDPKKLKRSMREVYHWSKIRHSHIQELLGVVLFKGRVGMVSPWRKHGNLRNYIKKHESVDRYALCLQVAKGMCHLHNSNMVHGDLKASNILVSEDGQVKLSDFDHSILSDCTLAFSDTTNFGGGTLRWMAPELVVPEDEKTPCQRSTKTDVYSLAMEILTTQVPYAEYSHDGAIYKAKDKKKYPNRPQELLGNERSDAMWTLLVRCWNNDPSLRPSATEFLAELEKLMI
ncbi:hypothetical protein OPQ81_004623 [Rhizoctonia solani]|nr:hypothetical protein OPQ81_004623 [Rhizoctonia solani]